MKNVCRAVTTRLTTVSGAVPPCQEFRVQHSTHNPTVFLVSRHLSASECSSLSSSFDPKCHRYRLCILCPDLQPMV